MQIEKKYPKIVFTKPIIRNFIFLDLILNTKKLFDFFNSKS